MEQTNAPWVVLLVDDEPAVYEVTRMMLARMSFEGRSIDLHHAATGAAAAGFIETHPETALVLLDVVMETDDAGLRLCRHIREALGNRDVQIVVRTGQPGLAPEREVLLRYEINGYVLKTEVTVRRLYSIMVCALRAWTRLRDLRSPRERRHHAEPQVDGSGLCEAIGEGSLEMLVEPIVGVENGRVAGVELLPVWLDGMGDPVSGAQLEALAEREGCALALGERLLCAASRAASEWAALAGTDFRVSVNMPAALLVGERLPASIERVCGAGAPATSQLVIEFSEAGVLRNLAASGALIRRLRAMGLAVVVDGFGTGSSSLTQLRYLDMDGLKVAPSLVAALGKGAGSAAIVRSMIALAHTFGMRALAEGVQTRSQWEFLRWEGCDAVQGAFIAAPLPASDARSFMIRELGAVPH